MKKAMLASLLGSVMAVSAMSAQAGDLKVIHAGELLAVPGKGAKKEQSIIIENDKIKEIKSGYVTPEGAEVIDLKNSFVMPGFMDMHVHLTGQLSEKNDPLKTNNIDAAMIALDHGMKSLKAGFTTVRDLGAEPEVIFGVRDAINKGRVVGPRIIAAGTAISATGGHGDVDGMKAELMHLYTPENICDGPYDCRRAVRHAVKYGADVIKITSTGGVLSDTATGVLQQMEDDELFEIVRAAKRVGRDVTSHSHGTEGINAALKAGVRSIEHGTYTDASTIKLFKQNGAYLVPTLSAGDYVRRQAEANPQFFPPVIRAKAIQVGTDMKNNIGKAYKGGVKIAFGTDSGVGEHGKNAYEFVLLTEIGVPNEEAIQMATVNAAEMARKSDVLGSIEAGKYADIVATDGNPLNDIKELLDVDFVMKGGQTIKK